MQVGIEISYGGTVYVIHEINPHPGFHLDEVVAFLILLLFGGHKIKIASDAKIIPRMLPGGTIEEWLSKGHLPLGQLQGVFDDKLPNGQRIKGECCATRAAQFCGVRFLPGVTELLMEVNRVDSTATASESDLSSVIKRLIDYMPVNNHHCIFEWAVKGVRAVLEFLRSDRAPVTDYVEPLDVLASLVKERHIIDAVAIKKVGQILKGSRSNIEDCLELSFAARAMKATQVPDEDVKEWLEFAIITYAEQIIKHSEACEELKRVQPFLITLDGCKPIYGVFVKSDNVQIAKASRGKPFWRALCVSMKTTGHVSILPNTRLNLNMPPVWALIRLAETPMELRKDATWEDYCQSGNHRHAPHWHMMDNGAMLNGTNHIREGITPTTLTGQEIIELVRIGLYSEEQARCHFYAMVATAKRTESQQSTSTKHVQGTHDGHTATSAVCNSKYSLSPAARKELGDIFDGNVKVDLN